MTMLRPVRTLRRSASAAALVAFAMIGMVAIETASSAHAQTVDDGSDAALGKQDAQTILALVRGHIGVDGAPKVTELRRAKGSIVCGSVNVKGKDGRYLGERGFVADTAALTFGRVPEGVELLDPRAEGFKDKEQIRQLYFEHCLD